LQIALLLALICVAWAAFVWALVVQHRAFNSNAYDFGFFDQIVWNTSQGRWFETSFLDYNFAGQHMEPVLLLFAAWYRWVTPNPEVMLVAQATAAAWAAAPLFLAARRLLTSPTAALLIAVAYLSAPFLHQAVLYDFHPEVIGTLVFFGALALLIHGRPGWAMAALFCLLLLKEDTALAVLGFALIFWLRGARRQALWTAGSALVYVVLVVGVLMTTLRGGPSDLTERYAYFGDSPGAVVRTIFLHPDLIAHHALGGAQVRAAGGLLATLALLPLATPAALAAAPLLAANLLSTHPQQQRLELHYPVLPFTLLVIAAVLRIERLAVRTPDRSMRLRWNATALAALLLSTSLIGYLWASPLGPRLIAREDFQRTPHTAATRRVLAAVPPAASVSAQSGLLPHLSQRRAIWEFPLLNDADYVVIDEHGWRTGQADEAGFDVVRRALPERGYCLLLAEDGVMLWARKSVCAARP